PERRALERLGLFAGLDPGQPRRQPAGDRTGHAHGKAARAVLGRKRTIGGDVLGRGAEAFQPHLAPNAESAGDGADADGFSLGALGHGRPFAGRRVAAGQRPAAARDHSLAVSAASSAGASAGAALASSAAARAASSRSRRFCARSFAALPGSPFLRFLRSVFSFTPAASRKRATRSVGCAPWPSQYCTRSRLILTRSSESLGSSGL